MLYEYAAPVSHESWLTAEKRRNMSERNRGAAADRQLPVLPAANFAAVTPDPIHMPTKRKKKTKHQSPKQSAEERLALQKECERKEMLERMRQTELNLMHARRFGAEYWQQDSPALPEDASEEKLLPAEDTDAAFEAEQQPDAHALMLERMQQSERNRTRAMQNRPAAFDDADDAAIFDAERTDADEIVERIAEAVVAEKQPDEQEMMLDRMRRSEQNRMRARYGETYVQDEPDAVEEASPAAETADAQDADAADTSHLYDYQDEYDTGRTHAGWVARRFLRLDSAFRSGFYFSLGSMVNGSSALQPDAEPIRTPEQPEIGYLDQKDLSPDADAAPVLDRASRAAGSPSARRKVSGGRYSEYGKSNSYQRRITTGGSVVIGLLTVLLIGCVIYGKVQTNEIYTTLAQLQAEYDDITAQNVSMRSEMEGKLTVKNIEEYAENVLGLRQLDQSQIEYVQIQTEDEVVISEPDENIIVTINDYLNSFWEFLRGA